MKLYKVLRKGGKCVYGQESWFLPKGKRKGKWMPRVEELISCQSGYHLCRKEDLVEWLNEEIYETEWKGKIAYYDNNAFNFAAEANIVASKNENESGFAKVDPRLSHSYVFKQNQMLAKRNAKIFLQMGNGLPGGTGWIQMDGITLKGISDWEIAHNAEEPLMIEAQFAVDSIRMENIIPV